MRLPHQGAEGDDVQRGVLCLAPLALKVPAVTLLAVPPLAFAQLYGALSFPALVC
jgi:hypothetical protein